MSAAETFRSYSDNALRGIGGFLRDYRPEWKEGEWVKEQKRLLKAEIEARDKEETEALKP